LGTSVLNISGGGVQIINTTNLTFSGASSTFNILANTNFSTIGLAFNAINFTSSGAFNYGPYIVNTITFGADCSLFRGDNTIGTLTVAGSMPVIAGSSNITNATFGGATTFYTSNTFGTLNLTGAGATYTFAAGTTQTINTALNITGGTGGAPDFLTSNSPGSQAALSMASGSVCTDYIRVTDINATGGATFTAGPSSQNVSNATGWTFIADVPNPTVTITANTGTTACAGTSVTFTAAFTDGGLSRTYQWFLNGVSV